MDAKDVRGALRGIEDPALGDDIVSLGLVPEVAVEDGVARLTVALEAPFAPDEEALADEIRGAVADLGLDADLRLPSGPANDVLPGVTNVVAVASGKGGVGKSTMSVNLAAGLADRGARVGLFDADIYGPNVPRMVGATRPPRFDEETETFTPTEAFGVKLMSMQFLTGDDSPVIWRGPIVTKMLTRFVEDVEWGDLDYLVVDLPPGTGDTQLTMLQTVPLTGAVIVTTPQDVALEDAKKGLRMFADHDANVLGIAENMSAFVCPDCGSEHDIFGSGGGQRLADEYEVPFLGSVPLDPRVRTGGDAGRPAVLDDVRAAEPLGQVVENTANNVGVVNRRSYDGRAG
jgi:ATP-binding protein involved in chromosome partitioning